MHVSTVSAEEVAQLIRLTNPQVVMVELCQSRVGVMTMADRPKKANSNQGTAAAPAATAATAATVITVGDAAERREGVAAAAPAAGQVVAVKDKKDKPPTLLQSIMEAFKKGEGLRGVFSRQLGHKMNEVRAYCWNCCECRKPHTVTFYWQIGENLDVMPGEEFRQAFREAKKINARIVLGDRPVEVSPVLVRNMHLLSLAQR